LSALREQIISGAVTALNSTRALPTGGEVEKPSWIPVAERARTEAMRVETDLALIVYPLKDTSQDVGGRRGPIVKRQLSLLVECWATETDTETADQRATALTEWVVTALTDNTLAGILNWIRETETEYDIDVGERVYCLAAVTLAVDYHSKAGALAQRT